MEIYPQFQWPLGEPSNGEDCGADSSSVFLDTCSTSPILPEFSSTSGQLQQGLPLHSLVDPSINFRMPLETARTPPEEANPSLSTGDNTSSRSPKRVTDEKQRARNRQSQRAFRERKDAHVKDLERQINILTEETKRLEASNAELKSECGRLRALVKLLMGDDSEGDVETPTDKDGKRATRLKNLLRILDSFE